MIIPANTWKNWYTTSLPNENANRNLAIFRESTNIENGATAKAKLIVAIRDIDNIIMTFNSVTRKMILLHSVTNLGGTVRCPENKIVAIEGFGPAGTPVLLDEEKFLSGEGIGIPTTENLLGVTQNQGERALTAALNNEFDNARFIILPPFLYTAYLEIRTRNPSDLYMATLAMMNDFDTANEGQQVPRAKDECTYVLKFLWATKENLLGCCSVPFCTSSDDDELQDWYKNRHNSCIQSVHPAVTVPRGPAPQVATATNVFHELSGSIRNNTLVMERFRQDTSDARNEKKNKFDSLHDSAKLLILNASSIDGECTPAEPVETCRTFYEKSTVGKAMDYFETTMKEKFGCNVEVSTGLITALYTGKFLRDRSDSPSNFSFFLVPKLKPMSSGTATRAMILQLKATQGKGWSDNDLKDAVKQGIETPSSILEFQHQMKNLWGMSSFFFGEASKVAESNSSFLEKFHMNTLNFEAFLQRDENFCTKVGYAIDTRVFRFLEQCAKALDREAVDDSALDLQDIVNDVLYDRFNQPLPLTFSEFTKKRKAEDQLTPPGDNNNKNKTGKGKGGEKGTLVKNDDTIEEWLCTDNTEYKKKFAGKNMSARPMMDGKPVCHRWHTKGYCFDICRNANSHVPSTELPEDIKTEYKKFVDICNN